MRPQTLPTFGKVILLQTFNLKSRASLTVGRINAVAALEITSVLRLAVPDGGDSRSIHPQRQCSGLPASSAIRGAASDGQIVLPAIVADVTVLRRAAARSFDPVLTQFFSQTEDSIDLKRESLLLETQVRERLGCNGLILLVGAARFELTTPCAQGRCATRLRYAPTF